MRNHFRIFTESVDPDLFGHLSKYRWIGFQHQNIFFYSVSTLVTKALYDDFNSHLKGKDLI
jgi:hypothetical protein